MKKNILVSLCGKYKSTDLRKYKIKNDVHKLFTGTFSRVVTLTLLSLSKHYMHLSDAASLMDIDFILQILSCLAEIYERNLSDNQRKANYVIYPGGKMLRVTQQI